MKEKRMLGRVWLEVVLVVVVVCAAKSIWADGGGEDFNTAPPQRLAQDDAESILLTQTTLRRYFIHFLADLQDTLLGFYPFHSVVTGILQGLQSREVDPLKSLRNGYRERGRNVSGVYEMATAIHSLQECTSPQITLSQWHSLLRTIPRIQRILPPTPNLTHLIPPLPLPPSPLPPLSLPALLLLHIQQQHLRPTNTLLSNILYNYPFDNRSPDLDLALHNIIQILLTTKTPLPPYTPNPPSTKTPDQVLADLLTFLLRHGFLPRLHLETTQVLSALSASKNVGLLRSGVHPWELLELIRADEYPPDVVAAAGDVAAAMKGGQLAVGVEVVLKGYCPLGKLLGLMAELAAVSGGDPLSGKVQAIYPHVKLRYLWSKGRFFQPRTSSDVAFLLNSFLTVGSAPLIGEVHKVFLSDDFHWRRLLTEFDYSKYSRPRSLLVGMLEELLRNSHKLPTCHLIFGYFLKSYSTVPACSPYVFTDDVLGERPRGPILPIDVLPEELTHPMVPPATPETVSRLCSDGRPVALIDPDSIIEIFNADHNITFILDLIRLNPMPVDKYPHKTRAAVYRSAIYHLTTPNHGHTPFLLHRALTQITLNHKANLPPRYLHLCPSHFPEDECPDNQTAVAVVDPDTILHALAPDAPSAPHVRARIKALLLPAEIEGNLTKGDVLREVLIRLERQTDSTMRTVVTRMKDSVMSTGPALESPDVVHLCLSDSAAEDFQQRPSQPPSQEPIITFSQSVPASMPSYTSSSSPISLSPFAAYSTPLQSTTDFPPSFFSPPQSSSPSPDLTQLPITSTAREDETVSSSQATTEEVPGYWGGG